MGHRLESAQLRLHRAQEHLEALESLAAGFTQSDPYTVTTKDDPDARQSTLAVQICAMPPNEWSTVIADCLHNYRSALDQALWAVITRFGAPTGTTQFPIHLTAAQFDSAWQRDVGKTSIPGFRTRLSGLQPYAGKQGDSRRHPLWVLREFERLAKHRQLGIAAVTLRAFELDVVGGPEAPDVIYDFDLEWPDPFHGDALTLELAIFSHSLEDVDVQFRPWITLQLAHADPVFPVSVVLIPTLHSIRTAVLDAYVVLQRVLG